jgi:hypothetical protein
MLAIAFRECCQLPGDAPGTACVMPPRESKV